MGFSTEYDGLSKVKETRSLPDKGYVPVLGKGISRDCRRSAKVKDLKLLRELSNNTGRDDMFQYS